MPELSFVVGLAFGIAVAGFSALGSFERGAASVRNAPWRRELVARHAVAARSVPVRHAATLRMSQEARSIAS
jgi:hypothetical protein